MERDFNSHKDILADMPARARNGQFDAWKRFNSKTVEERIVICEDEVEFFSSINSIFIRTTVLTLIDLYTEKIYKDHC